MEDKDRIAEIMRYKGMLAKNFCEITGINPASLSHILNGKTKASLPVLKNIVDTFPDLNPLWVLLGEGQMLLKPDDTTEEAEDNPGADLFVDNQTLNSVSAPSVSTTEPPILERRQGELPFDFTDSPVASQVTQRNPQIQKTQPTPQPVKEVVKIIEKKPRKIVEIRIFYDDGTYETFN